MAGNESLPIIVKIVSSTVVNEDNFECEARANIHNEESFSAWLKSFSDSTKTNWILRSSVSGENSFYDFSRDYVCQHSSFKGKKKNDHVHKNCQASLKVRIKRNTKYTRCRDPYVREGLRAILSIKFQHSHHLNVAEAWGWLKRKDVTRLTFIEYFNNGLSPADAIHYHEDALLANGAETLADASINPPKHWVYYLHNIWRKNEYGGTNKDENFYNIADKRLAALKKEGYMTIINKEPFKIILSVESNLSNSQLLPKQEPNPEPYETPPTSHVLLQNIKTEVILPDEYDTSEQQQSQHYHTPDATASTSVPPETVLPTPIVLWGSTENPPGVDSTCSSIAQTVEKEQQHEQPFKKSRVELLNSTEDRFDVFAKNVALKLREMDKTQRILVEKIINDALFEGEMGMLTRHHRLVDMSKNKDFLTNEEGVSHSLQYFSST